MYEITKKEDLSKTSVLMNVKAPVVAAKAEAGQFIILRSDKDGETSVYNSGQRQENWGNQHSFSGGGFVHEKTRALRKGRFFGGFRRSSGKTGAA